MIALVLSQGSSFSKVEDLSIPRFVILDPSPESDCGRVVAHARNLGRRLVVQTLLTAEHDSGVIGTQ